MVKRIAYSKTLKGVAVSGGMDDKKSIKPDCRSIYK
jgi:hypothetical protein